MDIQDIVGLLGSLDPQEVTDVEFAKYAAHSQALMPRLDDTQKLILYGLYKQASVGNAPEKPGDIDKASPDYYKWYAKLYDAHTQRKCSVTVRNTLQASMEKLRQCVKQ